MGFQFWLKNEEERLTEKGREFQTTVYFESKGGAMSLSSQMTTGINSFNVELVFYLRQSNNLLWWAKHVQESCITRPDMTERKTPSYLLTRSVLSCLLEKVDRIADFDVYCFTVSSAPHKGLKE